MSLINDALKQAKQSQPQNPPSTPPPLSPVESASQGGGSWLAPVLIILLLAAAGIFIGLSLSKHAPAAGVPPVAATQQVETAAVVLPVVTNPPPDSNTVAVVPPNPPEPKLQGILYAATRPCAIVSGKTVFVGDQMGEFRVAAISKDSVTLQSETETNVLSLSPR
ncbi:MAG TPA: hypothetical protein VKU37_03155 [Verrucomicrobiae bacterium]|nr:hypothetical protein [Verrucomicrobiae bacterium]